MNSFLVALVFSVFVNSLQVGYPTPYTGFWVGGSKAYGNQRSNVNRLLRSSVLGRDTSVPHHTEKQSPNRMGQSSYWDSDTHTYYYNYKQRSNNRHNRGPFKKRLRTPNWGLETQSYTINTRLQPLETSTNKIRRVLSEFFGSEETREIFFSSAGVS